MRTTSPFTTVADHGTALDAQRGLTQFAPGP